ncbi:MAG: KH domain-containing protein [Myxococcales bacterium FL481]|nr:MAG: KH domain-containing protein [Myxococcales bacterium FL481]
MPRTNGDELMTESTTQLGASERPELAERIDQAVPVVRTFLEAVLGLLGVEVEVDIDVEQDGLHCDLNTSEADEGLLIGRRGVTLDALQYLALRVLQAENLGRMRLTLDVGGYRSRREKSLRELAKTAGERVLDTGRPHHFEPMSAMERRVVHMCVLEIGGLRTESEGEGARRHVVVFPDEGAGEDA